MALWIPNYGIRTGRPRVRPSDFFNASRSLGQGTKAPWMWDGLVGWWPFVAGGGDKAYDFSGRRNHGDLTNMNDADWVVNDGSEPRMWLPRALDFDGSDDYVDVGDVENLEMTATNFTICSWLNIDAFSTGSLAYMEIIASKSSSVGGIGYDFVVRGEADGANKKKIALDVKSGIGTRVAYGTSMLSTDIWYQACAVFQYLGSHNNNVTIYLDGVSELTTNGVSNIKDASGASFYQGYSAGQPSAYYFSGLLADVRIYNRALNASEVFQVYNHGSHIVEPRPLLVSFAGVSVMPWLYVNPAQIIGGGVI